MLDYLKEWVPEYVLAHTDPVIVVSMVVAFGAIVAILVATCLAILLIAGIIATIYAMFEDWELRRWVRESEKESRNEWEREKEYEMGSSMAALQAAKDKTPNSSN